MAGNRKRTQEYWRVDQWHNRARQSASMCSTLEGAVAVSYRAFVSGNGYPESIVTPDNVTIGFDEENEAVDASDSLSSLWDEWLKRNPEERAAWDTGPRQPRLQMLAEQHIPNPRPFTSESIVANPAWYRRLYDIFGMTDEMFDTLLHVHRFAIAEKEAQRLAKEQADIGPLRLRRTAAIYLEGYRDDPERPIVPLSTQERACRAYCKRMGYKVHRVYRATTPPPRDIPLRQEIGIVPGEAFVWYRYDSNHPYHTVHNLLKERTIDIIIAFVESGPSRSFYGDVSLEMSSSLPREELASLWEIEPPTEDERQWHDLITRLGDTDAEEENAALMEQLRTLSKRMPVERRVTKRTVASAPTAVVIAEKPKLCFACQSQPARDGSAFCSDTCAQTAAERHVQATTRGWCGTCGRWIGSEGCPHSL